MIDPLGASLIAASSGLETQSQRMRIISQNLANANSTGKTPGADPYARKTVTFAEVVDIATGARQAKVSQFGVDKAPFRVEFRPDHPAADQNGYVKFSNVNPIVEVADMQDTVRIYEADLQVIKQTKQMFSMLAELIRK
ncbi:MAG: flagellar basal body rod protein FlgC [Anderseniella sp.]